MRPMLLLLAVFATPALAANASKGATLYADHCASCHTASHDTDERPNRAPDLVRVSKTREPELFIRWVREPARRAKDTACDTRVLRDDPDALADLFAYLQSKSAPAPLPRAERRRAQLSATDLSVWRNRKPGER